MRTHDGNEHDKSEGHISSWRTTRGLITLLLALVSLLSISLVLTGVWQHSRNYTIPTVPSHGYNAPEESNTCGKTTASAKLNNCSFDPLSFAWLPEPCFDDHLSQAFLWLRNWTWYFDAEGKQPAPYEEVIQGQHERVYVTVEHHILHCMYMWRKMHRAVSAGWLVDGTVGDFDHTNYCERMMIMGLSKGGSELVDEEVEMKWPDCPIIWP